MQVVILCGGQGTRIRDVADDIPKPMIPIGQRPILWHIMKGFAERGFSEFILCLGHKGWVIKRYFLDYHLANNDFSLTLGRPHDLSIHGASPEDHWQITFAETGQETMTGGRVKAIEKYLTGDRFFLTYGDGVADLDPRELLEFHCSHRRLCTVTAVRPPSRFGEIDIEGRRVVEFNEKPLRSHDRINGGFFVFERKALERLPVDPSLVLEQEPLMQLARDGELMAYLHNGFWQPMDSSRDYKLLNDLWNRGRPPWATWEPRPRLQAVA